MKTHQKDNKDLESDCSRRLQQLHQRVMAEQPGKQPLEIANTGYRDCDVLLEFIAARISGYGFGSPETRLYFYKNILTNAIALKVFCRERYYLRVNRTACTASGLKQYDESQLALSEAFDRKYGFFHGYVRSGMTGLDALYYLPGEEMDQILLPEVVLPQALGLGCCTYLFARFKAGEWMRGILASYIDGRPAGVPAGVPVTKKPGFVQTKFNLSVDQIGMAARAALDSALITGKSFQQVCEDLAPRIATPDRQTVSAGSVRSNAYTGEDIDKHTLIRYLEKMIRLIREY